MRVQTVGVEHQRDRRASRASARANSKAPSLRPSPGPERERAAAPARSPSTTVHASCAQRPVVLGQPPRHHLGRSRAGERRPAARRARTRSRSPRPRACSPRAAIRGAPVSPREPPATSTCPQANFVEPRPGAAAAQHGRGSISPTSACAGAPRGMPMSIVSHLARVRLARTDPQPGLGRVECHGDRRPHGRAGDHARRGVHAAWHVTLTTGRPRALIAVDRLRRPRRRARPESRCRAPRRRSPPRCRAGGAAPAAARRCNAARAARSTACPSSRSGGSPGSRRRFSRASPESSLRRRRAQHVTSRPAVAQQTGGHEPVAAVVALPAHHRDRPVGRQLARPPGPPRRPRAPSARATATPCSSIAQLSMRAHRRRRRAAASASRAGRPRSAMLDGRPTALRAAGRPRTGAPGAIARYSTVTVFARLRG